jgi:hypothetical protein
MRPLKIRNGNYASTELIELYLNLVPTAQGLAS